MPLEGDTRAPTVVRAGSRSATSAALIRVRSITSLAWAFATISSSLGNWLSSVATSSLPQRLCGTPRSAQYR